MELISAVLAAGAPEVAPFMADECLLSMPDIEGIDYTMKEYLKLVEKTKECVERLNSQGGKWTRHTVELAIWTHYKAQNIKPELLDDMPGLDANKSLNKYSGSPVNGEEEAVNGNKDGGSSSSEKNDEDSCDSVVEEQNGGVNQKSGAGSADQNGGGATEQQDPSTEQNGASEVKEVSTEQNGASEAQEIGGLEKYGSGEIEKKETELTTINGTTEVPKSDSAEKETVPPVLNGTEAPLENGTPTPVENGSTQNGVESNGESTKEETAKPSCDKRALEDDSLESEPKRMKDDLAVPPPPIPAGGD